MSDKLWCQMCGKEAAGDLSLLPRPTCPSCGAMLTEAPTRGETPHELENRVAVLKMVADIAKENSDLLDKLAERDALIEKLVEKGSEVYSMIKNHKGGFVDTEDWWELANEAQTLTRR